jgi:hypothetical protein
MAALLVWEAANLILRGDPLAHLTIPPLPALPETTNEIAKIGQKETNSAAANRAGTNGTGSTNAMIAASAASATNMATGTNSITAATNTFAAGAAIHTNAEPGRKHIDPKAGPPDAVAGLARGMTGNRPPGMMEGAMPGGRRGGGPKKIELPPEVQARVNRIIDSEILGPTVRPMPIALIGIADQEAFIQATNGQTGPVKVGGEIGGIKLLRIGINRVLVEEDGEKKELTLFGGIGGESLMPKTSDSSSTNLTATNASATNSPTKRASTRDAIANNGSTNQILPPKQKETQ